LGKLEMTDILAIARMKFPDVEKTFYIDMREYMDSLKADLELAKAEGNGPEEEEIERKMERVREYYDKIYNRRMEAIFSNAIKKLTSNKARVTLSKFTPEEVEIFHTIMEMVEFKRKALLTGETDLFENRERIPEKMPEKETVIENEVKKEEAHLEDISDAEDYKEDTPHTPPPKKKDIGLEEPHIPKPEKRRNLMTIRMTADAKEFVSLDATHTYSLKKGDVVHMDMTVAGLLVDMKKAEKVEPRW